jgi:hypothetical protein
MTVHLCRSHNHAIKPGIYYSIHERPINGSTNVAIHKLALRSCLYWPSMLIYGQNRSFGKYRHKRRGDLSGRVSRRLFPSLSSSITEHCSITLVSRSHNILLISIEGSERHIHSLCHRSAPKTRRKSSPLLRILPLSTSTTKSPARRIRYRHHLQRGLQNHQTHQLIAARYVTLTLEEAEF